MEFTYWDSIIDIWGRLFLLAIILIGGAIPSIKAMRGNGDREPLSRWAWLYVGVSAIAFIVSAHYMILDNQSNKLIEYTNNEDRAEIKESFTKYQAETKESFTRLESSLKQSIISDSTVRADLKNQGYRYQNGKIIPTKINVQKVGDNSGAVQINGPVTSSVVAGRDVNIDTNLLNDVTINLLIKIVRSHKNKCASYVVEMGSNAGGRIMQVKTILEKEGYTVVNHGAHISGPTPWKELYVNNTDKPDECLEFLFGFF